MSTSVLCIYCALLGSSVLKELWLVPLKNSRCLLFCGPMQAEAHRNTVLFKILYEETLRKWTGCSLV